MRKLFILCLTLLMLGLSNAQECNAPVNISVRSNTHSSVTLNWELSSSGRIRNAAGMELFNQADLVTHPMAGAGNADVSALYGGQTMSDQRADQNGGFAVADDFLLRENSYISDMEFFVYQPGSGTTSAINGVYVRIYDRQPSHPEARLIWGDASTNVFSSVSWSHIYRTSGTALTNTDRPVMKITATIDAELNAGNYWIAVCFSDEEGNAVYAAPRADLNQVRTGNALAYNPAQSRWESWQIGGSLEQMGLPFLIRGFNVVDSVAGFKIYRDQILLTDELVGRYTYTDTTVNAEASYCYNVQAVYVNGCISPLSENECLQTPEDPCFITSLPFEEPFDSYRSGQGTYPDCWTKYSTNSSTPYITDAYAVSSPGALFLPGSTNQYSMAVMPSFSEPVNQLQVEFNLRKGSISASVDVGIVEDISDPSNTFTLVRNLTTEILDGWENFVVNFGLYPVSDNPVYVAFRSNSGNIYLDDIFVITIPSCARVSSLVSQNPTSGSIDIAWTPAGEEPEWSIEYKSADESEWIRMDGLSVPEYTITGLEPGKTYTYNVRVKAVCTPWDESSWLEEDFNFTLPCGAITDLPYQDDFESYQATGYNQAGNLPECWNAYSNNTLSYYVYKPHVISNNSNSNSGTQSIVLASSGTDHWTTLILPEFEEALSSLYIKFWAKRGSNSPDTALSLGYVTDRSNDNTFTKLTSIITTTSGKEFEIFLDQFTIPQDAFLAFQWGHFSSGYSAYIDDLYIDKIPSCRVPKDLTFVYAGFDTARITWTAGGTETKWQVAYKAEGENTWLTEEVDLNPTVLLTGLTPGTHYDVQVKAVCSPNDESEANTISVFTKCKIMTLPYTEDFESYGNSIQDIKCWRILSRAMLMGVGEPTSPKCLYFDNNNNISTNIILQPLDEGIDIATLSLTIKANQLSANNTQLIIGILEDPENPINFTPIETVTLTANNIWEQFVISFAGYQQGSGHYIYFATPSGILIDDIIIDVATDCPATTGIAVSDISGDAATVSWNSKSGESYNIEYRIEGDNDWIVIEDTISPAYLTSLQANSHYEVRIITFCDSQDEPLISYIVNFNTSCGTISTLPYETGFDREGTGTGILPYCWSSYGSAGDVYIANTVYYSAPGALVFNPSGTQGIMAVMPALDGSILASSLRLSFQMYTNSVTDSLYIGFVNDPNDPQSFEFNRAVSPAETAAWTEITVDFSSANPSGRYIAFKAGSLHANPIFLDNVYLEVIPSCERPDSVMIRDITSDGALITWSGDENSDHWVIAYKTLEDEAWTTVDNLTDPAHLFTGLQSNVTYEAKVMKYCDPYNFSRWSNTVTFTTYCASVADLPYSETFVYGGTRELPECWIKNATPYSRADVYVTNTASNPNTLSFNAYEDTYVAAVVPQFTVPVSGLYATFKMYVNSIGTDVKVGVMADPYDINSFELIEVITPSTRMVWEEYTVYFSNYSGTGRFITFIADATDKTGENDLFLDNLTIDLLPECMFPFDIRVSDRKANEVTINWTGAEDADRWEIIYAPVGTDLETGTIETFYTKPFVLENLDPSTGYHYQLKTYCSAEEESFYSPVQQFSTRCEAVEIPYNEFFDTYGTGTNAFMDCWTAYSSQSSRPSISFDHFSYPGALYFTTSAGAYKMAVTPEINADLNTLQVRFVMKAASTENNITIGAVRDPDSVNSFEPIQTLNARTAAWNEFVVPLSGYDGNARYLAFKVEGNTPRTIWIDNLIIDELSSCTNPVGLFVDEQTDTSAVLHWTDDLSAYGWQVVYGPRGFDPDSEEPTETDLNTLYIDGLSAGTSYEFYVKKSCEENVSSEWSLAYAFNTLCNSIHLPYTENFDRYGTGTGAYPVCWYKYNSGTDATYPRISANGYSGEGALDMRSSIDRYILAIAPPVHEDYNMDDIYVEVMVRKIFTASNKLDIGYMTDPERPETFVNVETVSPDTLSTWRKLSVSFRGKNVQGRYVTFRSQNGSTANNIYIDDVLIDLIPDCEAPASPTVSAITESSALVSWETEGSDWILAYKTTSATTWTTIPVMEENQYELTSLSANTEYEVRLRSNCVSGEEIWSQSVTFTTSCDIIMAPFIESFAGTEFAPGCWDLYEGDAEAVLAGTSELTATTEGWQRTIDGNGLAGAHALLNLGGGNTHYWLATPVIDIEPLATPVLYFDLALTGHGTSNPATGNTNDKFMVLIATEDGQTWNEANTVVWANNGTADSVFNDIPDHGYMVAVPLGSYAGEKIRVAFYGESTGGNADVDLHLDNIRIIEEGNCTPPVITGVTPSEEGSPFSMLVTWNTTGSSTGWILQHRRVSWDGPDYWEDWQEINCTSDCGQNSCLLTGLDGCRAYEVRVRMVCGTGLSDWSYAYEFVITGTEEYDLSRNISVFPNPAQYQLQFRISDPDVKVKQITLFDIYGKNIRTISPLNDINGVDIQDLSSGIYFIRFETGKGMVTKKFIKE